MAIKIILVDDHQIVKDGLRALLEKQNNIEIIGESNDGIEAIKLAKELKPDIIITDINMPNMDGIDATKQFCEDLDNVKVIILSMHSKKLFISEALKAGARGYVPKERAFEELVAAIETVMADQVYISPTVVSECLLGSDSSSLSTRDIAIIKLIANGKSSKKIALELNVSTKTVDASRRQIMDKLNINSIPELVKYAISEGLTSIKL